MIVVHRFHLAPLGLALALASATACGSTDEPSADGTADGDGDGAGDEDSPADDGDTGGELGEQDNSKSLEMQVVQSTDISKSIAGKEVAFFDPTTGEILEDPASQTGGSDGKVTFAAGWPKGMGRFVRGGGDYTDTYNYPPVRLGEEDIVRLGSAATSVSVPTIAGYVADDDASPVAGSVLWRNKETNKDELVGCVTIVEEDGVKDVRFFAGTLPTDALTRAPEQGTMPLNASGLNEGEAGKYFIGNVSSGLRTIIAMIGGEEVGRIELYVNPRSEGSTISAGFKSNLTLANILLDESITENPTPANCQ